MIITGKPGVHIVNIVACGSLGGPVDLEVLASEPAGGTIMYEREQFLAATYRMETPKVVLLMFATAILCAWGRRG